MHPRWNQAVYLEALQELAVRISGERSLDAGLLSIVRGLAQQPSVALVRVWVTEPSTYPRNDDV